jgi:hypothetical protein
MIKKENPLPDPPSGRPIRRFIRGIRGEDCQSSLWSSDRASKSTVPGPASPAADRDRAFDRFYRVDKARGRDRGGSGLGLAVALSLVRAHGGTLDVTSEPGSTAFTLRIPLDSGPATEELKRNRNRTNRPTTN